MKLRHHTPLASSLEPLELRVAPAVLDIVSGALSFKATGGIANILTVNIVAGNYVFSSVGENITLGPGAVFAGFSGGGTSQVSGANAAVDSILIDLGDNNDTLFLQAFSDPLTAFDQAGADSYTVVGAINASGALTLAADTITINSAISGTDSILIAADDLAINANIAAATRVTLQQLTTTRDISLGTDVANRTSITDLELDRITTPVLQIGVQNGNGDTFVTAPISPANINTLALHSGDTITNNAQGVISVSNLVVIGRDGVDLTAAASDVDKIAGKTISAGAILAFFDSDDLNIGTVDGVVGLATPGNEFISLRAGSTKQDADAPIAGGGLLLVGAGPYLLNTAANSIAKIASNTTGSVNFRNAVNLSVGLVAGTAGVATVDSPIALSVDDGNITVLNDDGNNTVDIDAGTSTLTLTAGHGLTTDPTITFIAGAGVFAIGGVTLNADRMNIGAPIDAGPAVVALRPSEPGTPIVLGAADNPTILGITDGEIDLITAGRLEIGSADAADITITAAISPGGTNTLHLVSGSEIIDGFAGTDITVTNLALTAVNGIGLGDILETNVQQLEAQTTAGGIFISNAASILQIGGVIGSLNGVFANAGAITLINAGSIILAGTAAENIRTNAGDVNVSAQGVGSNIEVRNGTDNGIDSNLGNVTVTAGRDILLGSAATDKFGDVEATGDLALIAGRDIIIDEITFIDAFGGGDISINAGHSFSLTASDGSTGSRITAQNGSISITTGPGGTFSVNSSIGTNDVISANGGGSLTITADEMVIASHIGGTTATLVHLQPLTDSRPITLGEEIAGQLSLTDAELDHISADVLRIGSGAITGSISITGPVTQLGSRYDSLSLFTGGLIGDGPNGALQVSSLALSAARVNLFAGDYLVGRLAASAFDSGTNIFRFINQGALTIAPSIDGLSGLFVPNGNVSISVTGLLSIESPFHSGPGPLELTGLGIRQTAPITQDLAGSTVTIKGGTGTVTLSHPNNDFTGAIHTDTSGPLSIADKNDLVLDAQIIRQTVSVSVAGMATQTGPISGTGSLRFQGTGNVILDAANTHAGGTTVARGTLFVNGTHTGPVTAISFGVLAGTGTILGPVVVNSGGTIVPGPFLGTGILNTADVSFIGSNRTFGAELTGTTAGAEYDRLVVTGTVNLSGAALSVSLSFATADGDQFTIIDNDGVDPVVGTFSALPEGAGIFSNGHTFTISYHGGDGNDVVLTAVTPQVTLAAGNKIATYTDPDGDLVTIKTNVGQFDQSDFTLLPYGAGFQLLSINLYDDAGEFKTANLTITAKRTAAGGNGLVNVGYINSTGFDLGSVTLAGDLGQIDVGDGDSKFPALKSLSALSIGALGVNTQAPMGSLASSFDGALGKLTVRGDVRDASIVVNGTDHGKLGSVSVGGSVLSSAIRTTAGTGAVKILGDLKTSAITVSDGAIGGVTVIGSVTDASIIESTLGAIKSVSVGANLDNGSRISAGTTLGPVAVKNEIAGTGASQVVISAVGFAATPKKGVDLAIKSLTVRGRVEFLRVLAGVDPLGAAVNADASIGAITVGGDWLASTVLAGVNAGADGADGTIDDAKLTGGARDSDKFVSSIASITIKGQAIGTVPPGDSYGIVAELIGTARIGGASFKFAKGANSLTDAFASAPTGPGTTGLVSDFFIREATL